MSQPNISPRVAELLVSHICHDLVSPVGAISNGIEFIEEMGASATPDAMGLIGSSVQQASANLQCFRMAYGSAGSGGNITYDDIKKTFENYIGGGRVSLVWNATISGPVLPPEGFMKVLLNVMMMAKESLPTNGAITVSNVADGNGAVVNVVADRVEYKEGVENAFNHSVDVNDLTPRTVHAYLTRVFADYFNIDLKQTEKSENKFVFEIRFPQ